MTTLESTPTAVTDNQSAASSWDEAMKSEPAASIDDPAVKPVDTVKEPEVKTEVKAKSDNGTKPVETDEFPSELVEGKKEDKKPEEDPDAIYRDEPKGPVKHEHFKNVQTRALQDVTAARSEAESLRKEMANLKAEGGGKLPEEHVKAFDALKAERDALLERLGQSDYQNTPEFQSKFTSKEKQIVAALTETADAAGADKEMVASLLHLPLKRRMAMLDEADLSPSARSRIDTLLVRHDELQSDKAEELANWKTNATARQQEVQAKEQARQAADERQYEEAFKEITTELFETEPFRMIEGNEKWNAVAEKNRANAAEIVKGNLSAKAVVRAAVHAAGYETLLGMFRQVQGRNRDMAVRLAKYEKNGAAPKNAPHDGGKRSPSSDAESSRMSWDAAVQTHGGF